MQLGHFGAGGNLCFPPAFTTARPFQPDYAVLEELLGGSSSVHSAAASSRLQQWLQAGQHGAQQGSNVAQAQCDRNSQMGEKHITTTPSTPQSHQGQGLLGRPAAGFIRHATSDLVNDTMERSSAGLTQEVHGQLQAQQPLQLPQRPPAPLLPSHLMYSDANGADAMLGSAAAPLDTAYITSTCLTTEGAAGREQPSRPHDKRTSKQAVAAPLVHANARRAINTGNVTKANVSRFAVHRRKVKQNMHDLELELQQKLQELQLLGDANQQLKLKASVLENVVQLREHHIRVLQVCGPPAIPARSEAVAQACRMPLNSSDAGSSSVNTGNISSSSSVNTGNISSSSVSSSSAGTTGSTCTSVRSAGDCDEHVVETALKRNRPPRLFDNTGSQGSRSSSRDSSCSVAWKELLQQRLEQLAPACTNTTLPKLQEYKQLSFEQLVGSWKRHLCNAAQVLLALETADTAQAAAAAHASLQEWDDGFSGLCVIILNPSLMVKLTLLDMEANVEVNPYAQEQHWLEVLHGLQLTEEQLQLFMAVFELVARDLVAISRQRKALLTQVYSAAAGTGEATGVPAGTTPCAMQHTMPPELPKMPPSVAAPASLSAAAAAAAAAADAGSGSAEPSADLQRLLSQVQMTLKQEFLVIVTLNGALIDRVLSSKQAAQLVVLSWPLVPNVLGMAVAHAKATAWRPTGGLMAHSCVTRLLPAAAGQTTAEQHSLPIEPEGQRGGHDAKLQQAEMAQTKNDSMMTRRRTAAHQNPNTTGVQTVPITTPISTSGASGGSPELDQPDGSLCLPADAGSILDEVQGGRLAAFAVILEASERAVKLGG